MAKTYLRSILWITLVNGNVEANTLILHQQLLCGEVDLSRFIVFPYDVKCLQVALHPDHQMPCISWLGSHSIPMKIISHLSLRNRDIGTEEQGQCETFLIFAKSNSVSYEIFQSDRGNRKQFFPFTKIYFYISDSHHSSKTVNVDSMAFARNFLTTNALFGYIFELATDKIEIKDLLMNEMKPSILSYTPSDLLHPIVDLRLMKDNFTISLYNCKPFTVYSEDPNENITINNMDGTEYRFLKELTKNWKKSYNFRDYSRTKVSPYTSIMNDLSSKSTDMAMCSIWLSKKYYESYDLTTFYDQHCTTFLVPKPVKLNEATSIYTALNASVWFLFLFFFLLSSVLLNFISKMEKRLYERNSIYTDFSRAIMETVNTATSHSVLRFPSDQLSINILLTSWILLSVWMGISYTTIYASRLTSPGYEKPINTVRQFLEHGLHICGQYLNVDSIEEFRSSVNEDYRHLSTRSLVYGEDVLYRRRLFLGRKCGLFISRTMTNYVIDQHSQDYVDLDSLFRIMQDCVSSHYTVFAFQKYSPYSKLFNWHIRRYQEHGIIQKWYTDFSQEQKRFKTFFEDHLSQNGHRQINLLNLSGAFFLLCTGLLLSALQLFVEIIKYRRS